MKKYEKPSFEVEAFDVSDIITASSAVDEILSEDINTINKTVNFDELNL